MLGNEFSDSRLNEKVLVAMLKRYEAFNASLKNTKDLSTITLTKVIYALQTQEQQRLMKNENAVEGTSYWMQKE